MTHLRRYLLLIFISLAVAPCRDGSGILLDYRAITRVTLVPGFQRQKVSMGVQGDMLYSLWVPSLIPSQKVPLVVALHYAGSGVPYQSEAYLQGLVQPALQNLGAIIVAPDVPGDSWIDKNSEQAVMQFIAAAKEFWPVDPDKIVITGYSMGGIGTWYLADKYPEVFWAAIPMASEPIGFLTGKVPHYVIQGAKDELFGTGTIKRAVDVMKSKHRRVELVIADSLSHSEASRYVPYLQQSIPWLTDISAAP